VKAPFAMTLKDMIYRSCELNADRPALAFVDDDPISYLELREQIEAVMFLMSEAGIVKGDRVAILSQNMPNWGVAYLAITSMGAVVVPILVDFHVNEILYILRHSEAKMVFVSSAQYDKIGYADLDPGSCWWRWTTLSGCRSALPVTSWANSSSSGKSNCKN